MEFNNDFTHDLEVGKVYENEYYTILHGKKVEVKYNSKAIKYQSVFVEYESRGKPSGIATSQADIYTFAIGEEGKATYHTITLELLKERCRKYYGTKKDVLGGDNNTSKGIRLPLYELF